MNTTHLTPKNSLELALVKAQAGNMPMADFLNMMVETDLFIASIEEVSQGASGLHPLIFDRDGIPMAAVYTDPSRSNLAGSQVKSVIKIKGCDIFSNIPSGYGVVINPGFDTGLEILPDGVENIASKYCVHAQEKPS